MGVLNENIMVKIKADASQYSATLKTAAKDTENFGKKQNTTAADTGKLTKNIGTAVSIVGGLSAAVGVAAVSAFADFDEAMSEVSANTGATGEELQALRQAAIDAGASTVFSASEAAEAINELAKAGMSTTDILSGGLAGAMDLAASDGMKVADAAELISGTLVQFNLNGAQAVNVADALAAGAGKALGSAADLGQALQQVGVVAGRMLNAEMEETVGVLSAFAEAGFLGSDAGTSLKSVVMNLSAPSSAASKALDDLGVSAFDAQGNFVGFASVAQQLQSGVERLGKVDGNAAMAKAFGSDGIRAATMLAEQGAEGINAWTQAVSESGYAAQMAAAKTDNLKGDLESLSGSVETLLINIGDGANGPIRGLVQLLDKLVSAFDSLPGPVKQTMILFTAAAGGMQLLHGKLVKGAEGAGTFKQALIGVTDVSGHIVKSFGKIGDGITAVTSSIHSTGSKTAAVKTAFGGLKTAGEGVLGLLGGPWGAAFIGASAVMSHFSAQAENTKARVDELSAAMKDTGDATEVMAKQITESNGSAHTDSWIERMVNGYDNIKQALDDASISTDTYIKAVMGESDAAREVFETTNASTNAHEFLQKALTSSQEEYRKAQEAAGITAAAQSLQTQKTVESTAALAGLTDEAATAGEASGELAKSSEILQLAFGATTEGIDAQATALSRVIDAMQTYEDFAAGAKDAQVGYADSVRKSNELIAKGKTGFDVYTEAGSANVSMISDLKKKTDAYAESVAKNGGSLEDLQAIYADYDSVAQNFMQKMGATEKQVEELSESYSIGEDRTEKLKSMMELAAQAAESNAQALEGVGKAAEGLPGEKNVEVKTNAQAQTMELMGMRVLVETLPDGSVTVSCDDEDFWSRFWQVSNQQLEPKDGKITMDKGAFDAVMAEVNGATVDPKTGEIYGNDDDYWQRIAKVAGWTIEPKTGKILGDNGEAIKAIDFVNAKEIDGKTVYVTPDGVPYTVNELGRVERYKVNDKKFSVSDGGTTSSLLGRLQELNNMKVQDKSYTIERKEITTQLVQQVLGVKEDPNVGKGVRLPRASGGYVTGPGTGTSDSIPAMLSNGEYVVKASQTAKYLPLLEAINNGGHAYAAGGLVQATPASQYTMATTAQTPAIQYVQNVTNRMYSTGDQHVQAQLLAAKMQVATRKLISR